MRRGGRMRRKKNKKKGKKETERGAVARVFYCLLSASSYGYRYGDLRGAHAVLSCYYLFRRKGNLI